MTAQLVRIAAEKSFRESGVYELSVFASTQLDIQGIVLAARQHDPKALPHNRLQVSTAAAIRSTGCQLIFSEPPPGHCSLKFSSAPSDDDLEELSQAFDHPIPNPFPLSRR